MGEVGPLLGKLHHILAAGSVIVGHGDGLADILLGDAHGLLHAQLYRQSVGIPTCLTLHLEALHCLVAAEHVLDGTCHHMVNTRHTVCRGRTLIEHKRGASLTFGHTLGKHILLIPGLQHLFVDIREVQLAILGKFLTHILCVYYIPILIKAQR